MALGTARERQWKGMGKSRARQGKRQWGRADKAQKERQGPDPAGKGLRSGSPVLLHPAAFRKNGRRGNGNCSRKGKGQTRPGKAYDPSLPRSGSGNGMGKAVEKQWKGMGKARTRQGKGKGGTVWKRKGEKDGTGNEKGKSKARERQGEWQGERHEKGKAKAMERQWGRQGKGKGNGKENGMRKAREKH